MKTIGLPARAIIMAAIGLLTVVGVSFFLGDSGGYFTSIQQRLGLVYSVAHPQPITDGSILLVKKGNEVGAFIP